MIKAGVNVIDIGAESTRPSAIAVPIIEEINRLNRVLPQLRNLVNDSNSHSKNPIEISLDSRNYNTINHFVNHIDIINDVSGLSNELTQNLILNHNKKAIFMHSLSVPVKRDEYITSDIDIIEYIQTWLDNKLALFMSKGIERKNLIFDPGIGFGMNALQCIEVINRVDELALHGVQIMIGHSRKSFISKLCKSYDAKEADSQTHAITSQLLAKNIDYIRVHDVAGTASLLK